RFDAENLIALDTLDTKRDTTLTTADPAGQLHLEWFLLGDPDIHGLQLAGKARPGDRVTEEERDGVLVIHEVDAVIVLGGLAASGDGDRIVLFVLHNLHTVGAQQVFLPLPGIRAHVDRGLEPQLGAHDADG